MIDIPRARTHGIASVIAVLCALTAAAQDRPVIPHLGETIEVSIINVDVVVTDRKGNHIHGLTRDDFDIYENAKIQPFSNFAEYRRMPF